MINSMPFISIIIATYNSAATIKSCLESVLVQNFQNYEVLIIDGQSTDDTLAISNGYGDGRIKIFSEKDAGIYDAMNKGAKLASGQWLYFLGSDDVLYSSAVFSEMEPYLYDNLNMVYGRAHIMPDDFITPTNFSFFTIAHFNICHQAILYNKTVFEKYQYDLTYTILADWDLNLKIFAMGKSKILSIDTIISQFLNKGVSSDWKTSDEYRKHFSNKWTVAKRYLGPFQLFLFRLKAFVS